MYVFTCVSLSFLVQHIICASLSFLVHHSYASYIKALYCIVLLTLIYRELFIILTWYQSHCSKCFVQFFVFPSVLLLPSHLWYCFATTVRISVCPLPSRVEFITKDSLPSSDFFCSKPLIETPPPPLDKSSHVELSRKKFSAI
jgi:hypothetical protein